MLGGMGSAQEMMLVVLVAQDDCSGALCSRCQNSAFSWSRFCSVIIPVRCNDRHGIPPSNHLIGAERPDGEVLLKRGSRRSHCSWSARRAFGPSSSRDRPVVHTARRSRSAASATNGRSAVVCSQTVTWIVKRYRCFESISLVDHRPNIDAPNRENTLWSAGFSRQCPPGFNSRNDCLLYTLRL
jgi:hypothetical protein